MALTDEQRTMLQLLLEGGQGYDDIASLLGTSPGDVRSRARGALGEIAGADPDAQIGLSDYLLGQADPIGRADAVRYLRSDPDANAMAHRLVQNLRLLAPRAQLPEIPPSDGRRPAPAPPPPPAGSGAPMAPPAGPPTSRGGGIATRAASFFSNLSLSGPRRNRTVLVGAIGLIVVIVAVVLITSGGGGGSGDCAPVDTSAAQQAGVPTLKLNPVGGAANQDCAPTGQLTLVPISGQQKQQQAIAGFALQANASNLEPTENGQVYVLWLYGTDQQSRPLGQEQVKSDGNLTGAAPLPTAFLQLLPQAKIRLSLVSQSQAQQIQSTLQSQGKNPKQATGFVPFAGTPVLEANGQDLVTQLQQAVQAAQAQGGAQGSPGTGGASGGGKSQ